MNVAPLGPVAGAYYTSNTLTNVNGAMVGAGASIIVGPVGSGKSTASCLRLGRHSYEQLPQSDGVARTRWAVVRNTKGQLKDTTIKTWLQVFPEAQYGLFESTAMRQLWKFKPRGWDYPIEAEFLFRALDDEADVANMLSLEVTGFYFNEVREIDQSILMHAHERAGRYPAKGDGGARWYGFIADSNAWDTDHYLYPILVDRLFPSGAPADWELFMQPSGMSPQAENRENLPPGYYERLLTQHSKEDADVYVHAKWGRTKAGKPIYTDYSDSVHCRPFELNRLLPVDIGLDFGRTPAATIGQQMPNGNHRIRYELCSFDMGIKKFGEVLNRFISDKLLGFELRRITGDPSGNAKDGSDQTAFDLLAAAKIQARPATTNELSVRIEAVNGSFRRMSDGEPGLIIHPECRILRRACIDGYHFRKLNVTGNRYAEEPDKNEWSHVAEALQYQLLGTGEQRVVLARPRNPNRPRYAAT